MLLKHKSRKLVIAGQSGSGKSTFATRFMLNAHGNFYSRIFVFDHEGEFVHRIPSCVPCYTVDEILSEADRSGLVAFDPAEMFPGDTESAWEFFSGFVFQLSQDCVAQGDTSARLLFCDEVQKFSSTASLTPEFSTVLETGRRYGLDLALVTQQINLLHNRVRNQCTEVVCFRQMDKLILDALEYWGVNPDEVSQLDDGEYIYLNRLTSQQSRGRIFGAKKVSDSDPPQASIPPSEPGNSGKRPLEGNEPEESGETDNQ